MSEEEIRSHLYDVYAGEDWDFLTNYIMNLQQENRQLKDDISFCLKSIKQEMEMSIDSRTRKEMKTCYEILEKVNIDPNDVSKMFKNCTTLEPFLEHMDKVKE